MRTRLYLVSCILYLVAYLLPAAVFAQKQPCSFKSDDPFGQTIQFRAPEPRVILPGLGFGEITCDDDYIYVPFLGQYIAAVYSFAVAAASIIAVVVIIFSGFQWTASGGSQDTIGAAKKRIVGAITGLILAVGSYTILYAVNPELVQFRALRIKYVRTIEYEPEGEPDTTVDATLNIKLRSDCTTTDKLKELKEKFPSFVSSQTFGAPSGYCLKWAKAALNNACGGITPTFKSSGAAWDLAADFHKAGRLHKCDLNGIQDGDLVFMATLGSPWIALWEKFRVEGGCTVADSKTNKNPEIPGKGAKSPVKPEVTGTGMPPVTHVGVYVDGKIYHLGGSSVKVSEKPTSGKKTSGKNGWEGVQLQGNFVDGTYFIAGWASW
jgi:hypothetical protein